MNDQSFEILKVDSPEPCDIAPAIEDTPDPAFSTRVKDHTKGCNLGNYVKVMELTRDT